MAKLRRAVHNFNNGKTDEIKLNGLTELVQLAVPQNESSYESPGPSRKGGFYFYSIGAYYWISAGIMKVNSD